MPRSTPLLATASLLTGRDLNLLIDVYSIVADRTNESGLRAFLAVLATNSFFFRRRRRCDSFTKNGRLTLVESPSLGEKREFIVIDR